MLTASRSTTSSAKWLCAPQRQVCVKCFYRKLRCWAYVRDCFEVAFSPLVGVYRPLGDQICRCACVRLHLGGFQNTMIVTNRVGLIRFGVAVVEHVAAPALKILCRARLQRQGGLGLPRWRWHRSHPCVDPFARVARGRSRNGDGLGPRSYGIYQHCWKGVRSAAMVMVKILPSISTAADLLPWIHWPSYSGCAIQSQGRWKTTQPGRSQEWRNKLPVLESCTRAWEQMIFFGSGSSWAGTSLHQCVGERGHGFAARPHQWDGQQPHWGTFWPVFACKC